MEALLVAFSCLALFAVFTNAVPPDACFATFRWEDCGKEPKPVMYYWKPGSRCEVGIWRGCLPNLNMFKDEYECVSTCIFAVRALASSYHNQQDSDNEETSDSSGSDESTEDSTANSTDITTVAGDNGLGNDTIVDIDGNNTDKGADTTGASNSGDGTTAASGDTESSTDAPAAGGDDAPPEGDGRRRLASELG